MSQKQQQSLTYLLLVLGIVGFALIAAAQLSGYFYAANTQLYHFVLNLEITSLFYLAKFFEYAYIPVLALSPFIIYKFYSMGEKIEAFMLFLTGSSWFISQVFFKSVFGIACPDYYYATVNQTYKLLAGNQWFGVLAQNEACFPSAHTTTYVVLLGYAIVLVHRYMRSFLGRFALVLVLLGAIAFVGPSRIILGVHWYSDVLAAYFLSFAILAALLVVRKWLYARS